MTFSHDALAEDLAVSLGVLPYLNVVLGSAWLPSASGDKTRPVEVPVETLQALIFARQRPGARGRRLEDVQQTLKGNGHDWFTGREKSARLFGKDVAKLVSMVMALGGGRHGSWKKGFERAVERLKKQGWAA